MEEVDLATDEMIEEDSSTYEPVVQLIVLMNDIVLIGEIQEVLSELGEPDCRLIKPYLVSDKEIMTPWLSEYTNKSVMMISSDKILTLVEPNKSLLNRYLELIK
jgi:hypothetical protein